MDAIPKIYDKQNEQWVELMAKPIAKEVVRIMKEDFMRNKEDIKLSEITYGNEDEFRYFIAYQFPNNYINKLIRVPYYLTTYVNVECCPENNFPLHQRQRR